MYLQIVSVASRHMDVRESTSGWQRGRQTLYDDSQNGINVSSHDHLVLELIDNVVNLAPPPPCRGGLWDKGCLEDIASLLARLLQNVFVSLEDGIDVALEKDGRPILAAKQVECDVARELGL